MPDDTRLPWQLRLARLGEGLFLPVGVLLMAAIPFDQPLALVAVGAQLAVAIFAFRGFKRRSRVAWMAGMTLAVFIVIRIILRIGPLLREAEAMGPWGTAAYYSVVLIGWVLVTQLMVLIGCVALFGTWRTVLT